MVSHDGSSGDNDGFWSLDAGTGEIWRMEAVEPSSHFVRRGVREKEADLTFNALLITISARTNRLEMKAHPR